MQDLLSTLPGFAIALVFALVGFILGTLAAPISALSPNGSGLRLRDAFAAADARTDWRLGAFLRNLFRSKHSSRQPASDDELAVGGLLLAIAVAAYVRYADAIVVTIEIAAAALLVAATLTLLVLAGRKVVDSRYAVAQIIVMFALVGLGTLNGVLLLHPMWGGNPLDVVRSDGNEHLMPEGILTLVFQVFAVPLVLGTLLVAVVFCVACVTAAFIGSGAMWVPLWLFLYWTARWSTPRQLFWHTVGLACVGFVCASGLLPHMLLVATEKLSQLAG